MKTSKKAPRYPENIWLKGVIAMSGRTVTELAESIGYGRPRVSDAVNGHYKGTKIIPLLKKELGIPEDVNSSSDFNRIADSSGKVAKSDDKKSDGAVGQDNLNK